MNELLTPEEMGRADRLAIEAGTPGFSVMLAAGRAIARVAAKMVGTSGRVLVVCGGGNNGGDGYVAAQELADMGVEVQVLAASKPANLKGDAAKAYATLPNTVDVVEDADPNAFTLVVDALLGAGLDREVSGGFAAIIKRINGSNAHVLAVDLPSGISGLTGQQMGTSVQADETVTFFRKKPGHSLFPGRQHCGKVHVAEIGINTSVLDRINPSAFENTPALWHKHSPEAHPEQHKYHRGHVLSIGGGLTYAGAARLMAGASLRVGAGLVTLAVPSSAVMAHAQSVTSIMLTRLDDVSELAALVSDRRIDAISLGPGLKPDARARELVLAALEVPCGIVLDAGALSAFEHEPEALFKAIGQRSEATILTPHDGEYARLFGKNRSDRLSRARLAAETSQGVLVLKGADTVIASPQGQAAINTNAPPWLATAGSGDVLTGLCAGLLAQGMPSFEAACKAVWMHGEAANLVGPGLISSDLDAGLKTVIEQLSKGQI